METYIILAILSAVGAGVYSFIAKIAAYKNYNSDELLLHTYFWSSVVGLIIFFYNFSPIEHFWIVLIFAFFNEFFYYTAYSLRIESLKHIDSTIFFPVYKTIGPILVWVMSFLFFSEILTTKELFGVVLGIITSILLISKKEDQRQNDLKRGLILLLIGTILTTLVIGLNKIINTSYHIELYILLSMFIGFIIAWIKLFKKQIKTKQKFILRSTGEAYWGFVNGVIGVVSMYFLVLALTGNTTVVYTISSFSILITVLLSVIFFKEHFDFRKALAVMASILAGIFFVK